MRRFSTKAWSAPLLSLMLALAVWVIFVALRYVGALQHLELRAYDQLMKARGQQTRANSPVTVVALTESDIGDVLKDYPISNDQMADVLTAIEARGPAAIGVDIYRDLLPLGESRLNNVLQNNANIVMVYKAEEGGVRVHPPQALLHHPEKDGWDDEDKPDQIGFDDLLADDDGVVRRFLLILPPDRRRAQTSLAFQLALTYLGDSIPAPTFGADPREQTAFGKGRLAKMLSNDGGYVHATSGGYGLLFDGRGSKQFHTITVGDVLSGRLTDGDVKGCVVLLGATAASTKDTCQTSFKNEEYGVNVHAMSVDQLIRIAQNGDKPIWFWRKRWESAWILLWSLGGAALGLFVRSVWKFAVGVVAGLALLVAIVFLSFRHNLWLPSVPPAMAWFSSAALVASYISYREEKDRGTIMQLFSRHVSSAVAETIWQQRDAFFEGGRLRPRRAVATVLFTDLRGFSTLSEHADPSELMDWMNEYMSAMTAAVERHRGVVMKYIGDSVMAVFGIPLLSDEPADHADEARRAVAAAIAMREELTRLNAAWRAAGKQQATMRVGIHTGTLVVGSLGSADRLEYACLGDTVNVASRLESYDKDLMGAIAPGNCRILISQCTADLLGGHFTTFPLGEGKLHGRGEGLAIYAVLGRAAAAVTSAAAAGS